MSKNNDGELKEVIIYTDGGCIANPGPGGYGVVLLYGKHRREISGGYRLTTNNRMELMAAIEGLKLLKEPCRVKLYSDSRYVVDGISLGWRKDGKKTIGGGQNLRKQSILIYGISCWVNARNMMWNSYG